MPRISHLYVIHLRGDRLEWGLCQLNHTSLFQSPAALSTSPIPCHATVSMLNDSSIAALGVALAAVVQHATDFRPIDTLKVSAHDHHMASILRCIPAPMVAALQSFALQTNPIVAQIPRRCPFSAIPMVPVHFPRLHSLTLGGVRTSVRTLLAVCPELRSLRLDSDPGDVEDLHLLGDFPHLVHLDVGITGWEGVEAVAQQPRLTQLGCVFNSTNLTLPRMAMVLNKFTHLLALSVVYDGPPDMVPAAIVSTQAALNSMALPLSSVQVLRLHVPCALLIPTGFASLRSLSVNPVMQSQAPAHVQRLMINPYQYLAHVPAHPFNNGLTHLCISHDAVWRAASCTTVTHVAVNAARIAAADSALLCQVVAADGFPMLTELVLQGRLEFVDTAGYDHDVTLLNALGDRPAENSCLKRVTVTDVQVMAPQSGQAVVDALCRLDSLTWVGIVGFVLTKANLVQLAGLANIKKIVVGCDGISDEMCDEVQAMMAGHVRVKCSNSAGGEGGDSWSDWWCVVK